ncbi:hypothetical protein ANOM_003335, partial [Aspergillus nomiae NRRL 13137]
LDAVHMECITGGVGPAERCS